MRDVEWLFALFDPFCMPRRKGAPTSFHHQNGYFPLDFTSTLFSTQSQFHEHIITMLFHRPLTRRALLRAPTTHIRSPPRRTLIPAPGPNTGPLLERRADRELPTLNTSKGWLKTLPIFVVAVGTAILGIFNYQKSSSSVVSSTLYALRTSARAREILGDEIYFAQQIPWISGELNQLHGRIDISFWVKGTKGQGKMRFRSVRPHRMSYVSAFRGPGEILCF